MRLAVEHYLEHGRCIAATIKALGYPARGSQRAWIYKMHPKLHTRVVERSASLARPPSVGARIKEPRRTLEVACFLRYCLLTATDQGILRSSAG